MYGLVDYGAIADAAVDEMFGFDDDDEFGRIGPRHRSFRAGKRAVRRRTRRRREKRRAALGSPAWQQGLVLGQGYDTGASLLAPDMDDGLGSDLLDAEIDALLAEDEDEGYADEGDEYGYDADDYYGFDEDDEFGLAADDEYGDDDDEFGEDELYVDEFGRLRRFRRRGRRRRGRRRGRRRRGRAFRRGMKMARRKMKRRRRRRKKRRDEDEGEGEDQPQFDTSKFPLLLRAQGSEEEEGDEGPTDLMSVLRAAGSYGYYGNDAPPAKVQPPFRAPSFGESVVMGAGVGLGFVAAAFGVSALARGLGAK